MSYAFWFRRSTWHTLWIALRRARRDRRARRNLVRFALSFAILGAAIGWYYYLFRGFFVNFGATGTAVYIAIGLSVVLFIVVKRIADRREQSAEKLTSISNEMKEMLFREACLLAILLERLGSESYLEKEIPPDVVVVTRRVLLDRLAALGLRDNLEPWLLDLLLAPDGHWTAEQKQRAIPALECLAVLGWVLGLGELRSLTLDPKYSVAEARSLFEVKEPEKLYALASWDVRPARDGAHQFLQRCWAELVARRAITGAPEQDVEQALAARAEIQSEGYTGDYLVGARTIPELDTELLVLVARRAYTRWQVLSLLVDILSGETAVEQLRKFLAQYFASAEVAENLSAEPSE
jgi:hypothetical protein